MSATATGRDSGIGSPLLSKFRKSVTKGLNRSYLVLMAGSSVSMLGTRMSTIAYPMVVLYLTGSPVVAGWAAFAATAPSVLAYIPAGVLADRWNPRVAMLVSECGRGFAVAIVVLALATGHSGGWLVCLLIAMAVVEKTLEVFSTLNERRLIAGLLGRGDASSMLGASEARAHAVVLFGRPLGGLLFGIQPIFPFVADSLSFLCSIGSLLVVRYRRGLDAVRDTRLGQDRSARGVLDGLRWVQSDRYARRACLLNSGTTLLAQALIFIFLAEASRRTLSYFSVGVVLASTGAGGVAGSVAAARLRHWHRGQWFRIQMWIWLIVFSVIVVTFTMRDSLQFLFAEMFVLGFSGAIGNLEIDKYLMERSPGALMARVASVNSLMDFCAAAVGPVLGGLLVEALGPQYAILALMFIVMNLVVGSLYMPSPQGDRNNQTEAGPDEARSRG